MIYPKILLSGCLLVASSGMYFSGNGNDAFSQPKNLYSIDSPIVKSDTFFKGNNVALTGDSNTLRKMKVLQYCNAEYRFYDYPAVRLKLVPANMNAKMNDFALANKKVLAEQYKRKGVNFAGHYSFLWLGKEGAGQFESVLVDARNGNVYPAPPAENLGAFYMSQPTGIHSGYKFKRFSRMLIVNPVDSSGYYDVRQLKNANKIYLWNDRQRKFERLN